MRMCSEWPQWRSCGSCATFACWATRGALRGALAERSAHPPVARSDLVLALEGPAERLLGLVADPACDRGDTEVGGGKQVLGEVHPPRGEVADRRHPQHGPEALV